LNLSGDMASVKRRTHTHARGCPVTDENSSLMTKNMLKYWLNTNTHLNGPTKNRPDAARSRPDVVRRPTPPGAIRRPPHQTGPQIWLQLILTTCDRN